MGAGRIRLIVADDHPVVREGLCSIVRACDDMEIVAEASDGESALDAIGRHEADVLVLDVSMPGPPFLEILDRALRRRSGLRILVLSIQPEEVYALRALRAGASGYLTKDRSAGQLAAAIRRVHGGGKYISDQLAERLIDAPDADMPAHALLSDREFQVLRQLGAGKTTKEIAALLNLSPKTISTYRVRVLEKLGLKTTAELIRYAIEHNLGV